MLPAICAIMHCDKHVVKMIIETAQILSAAHWLAGSEAPYSLTKNNNNKPMNWARASLQNYRWLVELGLQLCDEYTHRYEKVHKSQEILQWLKDNEPNLPDIPMTSFEPAVPVEYIRSGSSDAWEDVIASYRAYYVYDKRYFAKWSNRDTPEWYTSGVAGLTPAEVKATEKEVLALRRKKESQEAAKKKAKEKREVERAKKRSAAEAADGDESTQAKQEASSTAPSKKQKNKKAVKDEKGIDKAAVRITDTVVAKVSKKIKKQKVEVTQVTETITMIKTEAIRSPERRYYWPSRARTISLAA